MHQHARSHFFFFLCFLDVNAYDLNFHNHVEFGFIRILKKVEEDLHILILSRIKQTRDKHE